MPKRKSTTIIASAAVFIILEIAAFALLRSSSTLQSIWINRASHKVSALLWSKVDAAGDYFSLREDNLRLSEENEALRMALYMKGEEVRMDSIMRHYREPFTDGNFEYIHAGIVKIGTRAQRNYIILNKGYEDGVFENCGIITGNGAVGIIDASDRHYSYGRTLMNTSVTISSRLGREGVTGPLSWDGINSHHAVVRNIPNHYTVPLADTVWTSGFSNIFPSNIPIGTITGTRSHNGATQDVEVELFQDFAKLEHVTIARHIDAQAIEILEHRGASK